MNSVDIPSPLLATSYPLWFTLLLWAVILIPAVALGYFVFWLLEKRRETRQMPSIEKEPHPALATATAVPPPAQEPRRP